MQEEDAILELIAADQQYQDFDFRSTIRLKMDELNQISKIKKNKTKFAFANYSQLIPERQSTIKNKTDLLKRLEVTQSNLLGPIHKKADRNIQYLQPYDFQQKMPSNTQNYFEIYSHQHQSKVSDKQKRKKTLYDALKHGINNKKRNKNNINLSDEHYDIRRKSGLNIVYKDKLMLNQDQNALPYIENNSGKLMLTTTTNIENKLIKGTKYSNKNRVLRSENCKHTRDKQPQKKLKIQQRSQSEECENQNKIVEIYYTPSRHEKMANRQLLLKSSQKKAKSKPNNSVLDAQQDDITFDNKFCISFRNIPRKSQNTSKAQNR